VPLAALLERAGVEEDACEIELEESDRGMAKEPPAPPVPISYARSLPRNKAIQREALIAYQMNGRDLTQDRRALGRNQAEVRDRPATRLRNPRREAWYAQFSELPGGEVEVTEVAVRDS
jgi:hypothetical protein